MLHADTGSLLIWVPPDHLEFAVSANPTLVGERMPASEGIAGWVFSHEQPLIVSDKSQDERWFREMLPDFQTQSLCAVPLMTPTERIGVIEVLNKKSGELFNEQDRDIQSAMQVYENALKHNPNFWFAANNLAYLISEATTDPGALKRAYKLAEKAISLRPNEPAVLDTLAWISYQQKDYNRALGFMDRALERAPDAAILNFHMGMILTRLGRNEEAKERLEKSLSGGQGFIGREIAEKTLKDLG